MDAVAGDGIVQYKLERFQKSECHMGAPHQEQQIVQCNHMLAGEETM